MPAPDRAVSDRGIDSDFPIFGLMIEPLFHISCRWKSVHFSVSSVPDIPLLAYQHTFADWGNTGQNMAESIGNTTVSTTKAHGLNWDKGKGVGRNPK